MKIEGKISMKGVVVEKQRRDEKVEDLVLDQRRGGVQKGKNLRWKEREKNRIRETNGSREE